MRLTLVTTLAASALYIAIAPARADIRLPAVISEHMVLQRGTPVRLWGWANDGEAITVTCQNRSATATAEGGKWSVTLPALKPGGPYTLTFKGANTITFSDVLVGEVWVSCGQSNMMMNLSAVDGAEQAIAESTNCPQVRQASVTAQKSADTPQEDVACAWTQAGPKTVGKFSAVSYYFARALNRHLGVPVGMINAVAIMPGEAWIDRETLLSSPELRGMENNPIKPITTFNAMIAPLTSYTIRGAIYYQGEYNGGRGRQFRAVMPAIISTWRKAWNEGDFPFLFVQLPSFYQHLAAADKKMDMPATVLAGYHSLGGRSAWAEVREAQLMTWQRTPNTGMAITIDLGDAQDIHPKRKQPVGERLALVARGVAYKEPVVYSGPVFDSLSTKGNALVLKFKYAGKGLVAHGSEVKGFEIAGADHRYVWAKAKIAGDTIVLSSPEVQSPALVRYAWADYPTCNLYNVEGLPASPFRASVESRAYQVDRVSFNFQSPGFEDEKSQPWVLSSGASRTQAKVSEGKWSVEMSSTPAGNISLSNITSGDTYLYDWASDLLDPLALRPGMVAGYSVDMASDGKGVRSAYMRLCADPTAGAYQFWGGVPTISTASADFVSRKVATRMSKTFDIPGGTVGAFFANEPNTNPGGGTLYLDNFSPVQVIRPVLGISDKSLVDLGTVRTDATATSTTRLITNQQSDTLPDQRSDGAQVSEVATILYGAANLKSTFPGGYEHVWGDTDDVGATIIGKDARSFEFVSEHLGTTHQELKLIGNDGVSGLIGGASPESEKLTIKFLGSNIPGTYGAKVRIITQAGNCGKLSTGQPGEPPQGLYYFDLPIKVKVAR